jgi:hypothetical protein
MIHSKFISIILAAFCGLASQLHASPADAQYTTTLNGIPITVISTWFTMTPNTSVNSPHGVYLSMQNDGNLVVYNQLNNPIWASYGSWLNCGSGPGTCPDSSALWFMLFAPSGNIEIYNYLEQVEVWQTGPEDNTSTFFTPPFILAVQDDGNLVIYDSNYNVQWAASWQSNFNWAAAEYAQGACGC